MVRATPTTAKRSRENERMKYERFRKMTDVCIVVVRPQLIVLPDGEEAAAALLHLSCGSIYIGGVNITDFRFRVVDTSSTSTHYTLSN